MTGSNQMFAGSADLGRVLTSLPMTCLDVGARLGFTEDLLPLAPMVDADGFEPDVEECERLNAQASTGGHPWRSLRYLSTALGPAGQNQVLNLYRQRGCSSLLTADKPLADRFSRGDYFELDATVPLATQPLDDVAQDHDFANAVFLKIDVQGFEAEVFKSGAQLLGGSLLAIRAEVSFIPIYQGQPLFGDIAEHLRQYNFIPMGFEELHHWRRSTKVKHPRLAPGPTPYSRGQMIHGDVVFFRDPETMADNSPDEIDAMLKSAFLALAYEYVDHAAAIFSRPNVARALTERFGIDPETAISDVSQNMARRAAARGRISRWQDLRGRVKDRIGNLGAT